MSEFDLLVQTYIDMGVPEKEAITQANYDMKSRLVSMKYKQENPVNEVEQ